MPGTFFALDIGRSGLQAAQIGEQVTGQNIANAGTDGYSVQSVNQEALDPYPASDHNTLAVPGLLGAGVAVKSIGRARDQFLDTQVRNASSGLQFQSSQSKALTQVDAAFGEPSDTGLNAALNAFSGAFHDLANNPESLGVRAAAVQNGDALARSFQGVQGGLTSVATSLGGRVATDVSNINAYGSQIAALNVTIRQQTTQGQPPNDLLDRRDVLLDKLSALANTTVTPSSNGTVNVEIGNVSLVTGLDASPVTLAGLTAQGDLKSGELAGLTQAQSAVSGYQTQLNTLAASVVSQVNAAHSGGTGLDGTTGLNFFSATAGSEAATLAVNPVLVSNPEKLAAAGATSPAGTKPPPGDGSVATIIAGLKDKTVTTPGDPLLNKTIQGFYQQVVSDAGGRAASAKTATDSAQAGATQLGRQRDSVTGVSTDTELANLLQFQRAYQASARVIQTADDMVGTLINNLFAAR